MKQLRHFGITKDRWKRDNTADKLIPLKCSSCGEKYTMPQHLIIDDQGLCDKCTLEAIGRGEY